MRFFKDVKFGGGSIGTFDTANISSKLIDLVKGGTFRTDGNFAPGYTDKLLQNGSNLLSGLVSPDGGAANTNKPTNWSPSIILKPLTVKTADGGSKRYEPGFLPPSYLSQQIIDKNLGNLEL